MYTVFHLQESVETSECGGGKFSKRRKFAVLLSYSGKGYMGMQKCVGGCWWVWLTCDWCSRNPGVRTIEEDLLEAMCQAKAFPPVMRNDLATVSFPSC